MKYDFAAIEKKWQDKWEQVKPYAAVTGDKRPKFYGLIEFPYPSAAGLHVGHPRPFTAMDIICRKKRNVIFSFLYKICNIKRKGNITALVSACLYSIDPYSCIIVYCTEV